MTHKVHPFVFRLGQTTNWKSRWLDRKRYKEFLKEDLAIRDFVIKKFGRAIVTDVEIERSPSAINLIIVTPRPGLIIGRGGSGAEDLKKEIERKILKILPEAKKKSKNLRIEIQELKDAESSAAVAAANLAEQIEKRIPTKRAMKRVLEKIKANKNVKGVKIKVSGRIDGAEIARRGLVSWGSLPLQNLRANIDYAETRAECTYGTVGIKVWVYKGEQSS